MAITRRQFLKRGGLVTAGTLFGPQLFANPLMRQAYAALEDNSRYFVIVFLDGGNDGLNTVIPYDNVGSNLRTAYNAARGNLNITPGNLTAMVNGTTSLIGTCPGTGTQLGLHPGFNVPPDFFKNGTGAGGLKALYTQNKVAVIQGCGYPEYSLSHEEARVIWQTGVPLGTPAGTGWVGRHLAAQYGGNQIPAVNIDDSIVGEFRQTGTSVLAVRDLDNYEFPFDGDYPGDVNAKTAAFSALNQSAVTGGQPAAAYIGNTGKATIDSAADYQQVSGLYRTDRSTFNRLYGDIGKSLSNDLREVARVIYGVEEGSLPNVKARFFQVSNGGYDTHSDQGAAQTDGQHYSLHAEVGGALKVFMDDLSDMGVANRICVLVWSEFSRRVPQNDNGTDHGSQGPMFVIGGGITPGVYGNHPNINDAALDNEGNTEYTQSAGSHRSTDFRDVYGTILKHWVNLPQATVQGLLPLDATPDAISDPAHYWRTANFNMGFLP
jgi:uncharacterized protein (DUF1501 family)